METLLRLPSAVALVVTLVFPHAPGVTTPLVTAEANPNTSPAGTLRDRVLSLSIDVTRATWHIEGDRDPDRHVLAFAEAGKAPLVPGPLVRVPAGTEVRFTFRNMEGTDTLTFFAPAAMRGGPDATWDSVAVAPGGAGHIAINAAVPGSYFYRARANDTVSRVLRITGALTGAIVVDSVGTRPREDRILMLTLLTDSVVNNTPAGHVAFAINGRSWPHTERMSATVGDTLRWRVINAGNDVHPMHLHGFYYRVESLTGQPGTAPPAGAPGRMVVTERMPSYTAMSMSWVPERAGNWLFHCHFQLHVANLKPAGDPRPHMPHENHAMSGMRGLVMGVTVHPRRGDLQILEPAAGRPLRVRVVRDSGGSDAFPSLRYVTTGEGGRGVSDQLNLVRGEPVAITVVNTLTEPTAVHWHGMELDSYYDGVAGYSGTDARLSPIIAPGDSFVVRFTPPRAGTFMYHSHVDEPRTHRGGLVGALIVREPGETTEDDHAFVIKTAHVRGSSAVLDVNGRNNPDTLVFRSGRPVRLRFMSLALVNPNATVWLTTRPDSSFRNVRDTLVVQWRAASKDGAELPPAARSVWLARQIVGMGETYDFEYTPSAPGRMRIEVRGAGPNASLLARVPIRVE